LQFVSEKQRVNQTVKHKAVYLRQKILKQCRHILLQNNLWQEQEKARKRILSQESEHTVQTDLFGIF
jgi:hypothetical protein